MTVRDLILRLCDFEMEQEVFLHTVAITCTGEEINLLIPIDYFSEWQNQPVLFFTNTIDSNAKE